MRHLSNFESYNESMEDKSSTPPTDMMNTLLRLYPNKNITNKDGKTEILYDKIPNCPKITFEFSPGLVYIEISCGQAGKYKELIEELKGVNVYQRKNLQAFNSETAVDPKLILSYATSDMDNEKSNEELINGIFNAAQSFASKNKTIPSSGPKKKGWHRDKNGKWTEVQI